MKDQYSFDNPVTRYERIAPPEQQQPEPGLDRELKPKADHGEETYRGSGSPVAGRSSPAAIPASVRPPRHVRSRGADVAISYLPQNQTRSGSSN